MIAIDPEERNLRVGFNGRSVWYNENDAAREFGEE